jgi:hypothetical protein
MVRAIAKNVLESGLGLTRVCALGALLFGMVGCATIDHPRVDPIQAVTVAATERWEYLGKGNLEAAYKLLSPARRSVVSFQTYVAGIRPGFWTGGKVTSVTCESEVSCKVGVEISFRRPVLGGEVFSGRADDTESWIFEDNRWWFVPKK